MSGETVATTDEIPEGEGIGVNVNGIDVAVFNVEGEFYAVSNRCPHKGASLSEAGELKLNSENCTAPTRGRVDDDGQPRVYCPWHWWEWDLESGENHVTGQRVRSFDVDVVDGEVQVDV